MFIYFGCCFSSIYPFSCLGSSSRWQTTLDTIHQHILYIFIMNGSRKLCQCRGCPTLSFFFDNGREDQNSTKSGPSSAHQRNAIEIAFRWWADDDPTLYADIFLGNPDQYCQETRYFCDFSRTPFDLRMFI